VTGRQGLFLISLDFELNWGVRDIKTLENYKPNLLGARAVVPRLLELFAEYEVHTTWATVGLLFFAARDELIQGLAQIRPRYANPRLSPYEDIDGIGANESADPFHYAASLIKAIATYPGQEIASHTFSHYYCLEKGQDVECFREDLRVAVAVATKYGLSLRSLVFPRNQVNEDYLPVCREAGILAYRGNPSHWMYRQTPAADHVPIRRGLRIADAYFNISSHNSYSLDLVDDTLPLNIPASRFLRPYSPMLAAVEQVRLQRIMSDMTWAAQNGQAYHLWWHPHNFGIEQERNLDALKRLLTHLTYLREVYGIESLNMGEVAQRVRAGSLEARIV
jgi:peptidoglycan/xylan/chitin deacetylase (PgdA/CDA1 family)